MLNNLRKSMRMSRALSKAVVDELSSLDDSSSLTASDESSQELEQERPLSPLEKQQQRRQGVFRSRSGRALSSDTDETSKLLASIRETMATLAAGEREYRKSLRVDLDKAKARLEAGNERGAILSMRKVHKHRLEQNRLLQAIGYLRQLEEEMEGHLKQLLADCKTTPTKYQRRSRMIAVPKCISFRHRLDRILASSDKELEADDCEATEDMTESSSSSDDIMIMELTSIMATSR